MKISRSAFFIILLMAGLQPSFSKEWQIVSDTIRPSYYNRWVPLDWALPADDNKGKNSSQFTICEIGNRIYLVNNCYQNRIFYYDGNKIIPFNTSIPFPIRTICPLRENRLLLIGKDTAAIMDQNGQITPFEPVQFLKSQPNSFFSINLIRPMPDSTYLILSKFQLFLINDDGQIIWKGQPDSTNIGFRNDYQLPSGDCLVVMNQKLYFFSLRERKLSLLPFDSIRDIFEWNGKIMIVHDQNQISEFRDNRLIPHLSALTDEFIIQVAPLAGDKLAFRTKSKLCLWDNGRLETLLDLNRTALVINSIFADSYSILYVATDQGILIFPYLDIENYPIEEKLSDFDGITRFQADTPDHWIAYRRRYITEYRDHHLIKYSFQNDSTREFFLAVYSTRDYLIFKSSHYLWIRKRDSDSFRLIPYVELKSNTLITDYQDRILFFNQTEKQAYQLDPVRLTIKAWPEAGINDMFQLDSIHYLINNQIIYNGKSHQLTNINNPNRLVFSRGKTINPDNRGLFLIDNQYRLYVSRDRELYPLDFLSDRAINRYLFPYTQSWLISDRVYRLSNSRQPFNPILIFWGLENGKIEPIYQRIPPIFKSHQLEPNYSFQYINIPETGECYTSHRDTLFKAEPHAPFLIPAFIMPHPICGISTADSGQTLTIITNFGVYHYGTSQNRLTEDSINTTVPFNFRIIRNIDQNLYHSAGATVILDERKPFIINYPVVTGTKLNAVLPSRNQESFWLMNQGVSIVPDHYFESRIPAPQCHLDSVTLEPNHQRVELDSKLASSTKNLIFHFSINSRHYPYELYYSLDQENWSKCESGNRIILNNLNPGRYQLKIILSGNNQIRQSQDLIYRFEIDKYWWTKWEYLSGITLAMIGIFYAIGYVIYRNRLQQSRIRMELDSAGRMNEILQQHSMVSSPNLQIDVYSQPFFLIGGDFFEIIPLGDDKTIIIIGDVSGHGLDTSLMMATIKGTLAGLTTTHSTSHITPEELNRIILHELNRIILENPHWDKYLTLLIAQFDFMTHTCRMVSAGHPHPIYVSSEKRQAEIIKLRNTYPIGWTQELEYNETLLQFQPNDQLFLYTDGLINLKKSNQIGMDEKELADTIQTMITNQSMETYKDYLTRIFKSYQNLDDQTMLMIRIK